MPQGLWGRGKDIWCESHLLATAPLSSFVWNLHSVIFLCWRMWGSTFSLFFTLLPTKHAVSMAHLSLASFLPFPDKTCCVCQHHLQPLYQTDIWWRLVFSSPLSPWAPTQDLPGCHQTKLVSWAKLNIPSVYILGLSRRDRNIKRLGRKFYGNTAWTKGIEILDSLHRPKYSFAYLKANVLCSAFKVVGTQ